MKLARQFLFAFLSLGLFMLSNIWAWGSSHHQTPAPVAQEQPQDQSAPSNDAVTFTGTVVRDGDQFTLRETSGEIYLLENSERAKPFEGKSVKVTGHFGNEAKIIHVETIALVSQPVPQIRTGV